MNYYNWLVIGFVCFYFFRSVWLSSLAFGFSPHLPFWDRAVTRWVFNKAFLSFTVVKPCLRGDSVEENGVFSRWSFFQIFFIEQLHIFVSKKFIKHPPCASTVVGIEIKWISLNKTYYVIGKIHKHVSLIPSNVNHNQNNTTTEKWKEQKTDDSYGVKPDTVSISHERRILEICTCYVSGKGTQWSISKFLSFIHINQANIWRILMLIITIPFT